MVVFGTVVWILGGVALALAAVLFALDRIFASKPHMLGKAPATLQSAKHRKNVPVYEKSSPRAPRRVVKTIKNWSRGTYIYTVNGKTYRIRYVEFVPLRAMPVIVQVVYLRRLPRIAYVKTDTGAPHFAIYAFGAVMFSVLSAVWGLFAVLG